MKILLYFLQHEINNVAESQRIPLTYGNSDDEDLAGSGEIEGSANEEDLGHRPNTITQHRNTDGKARKSLIFQRSNSISSNLLKFISL